LVKQLTLVKYSNLVKDWSNKGVKLQKLIFLDVSANLDYMIENGLLRKLMQVLFGDNLSDIFK